MRPSTYHPPTVGQTDPSARRVRRRFAGTTTLAVRVGGCDDHRVVTVLDPELRVEQVDGHPGRRRLVVTYRLEIPADDPVIGRQIQEEAVVTAVDEHDAPVRPEPVEFRLGNDATVDSAGVFGRRLWTEVHRFQLDVERDWWDTDQGGGTKPILELVDHLTATVSISLDEEVVASGVCPTTTGSWGALGSD